MSVITPKDLAGKTFSTAFKGYNKNEVDEYVSKVTKNYTALFRKCAEMEENLAVANLRLENISKDERKAKETLEAAKEKSDIMIAEAYERADDILVTIKKNCDSILRDFREKIDTQKNTLAEMNARVEYFKKDIFAKYKTHIEILEQLAPSLELEDEYTSGEYVANVINELKYEISAEYDIDIGYEEDEPAKISDNFMYDAGLDEMPTEEEIGAFINTLTKKAIPQETDIVPEEIKKASEPAALPEQAEKTEDVPVPTEEIKTVAAEKKTVIVPSNKRSSRSRRRKKSASSVMEMLSKYDAEDALNMPTIEAQLMLNLDDASDSLISSVNEQS